MTDFIPTTAGTPIDQDGDGIIDRYDFDTDGDGIVEQIGYDSDRDGRVDTVLLDTTGDGQRNATGVDTDGDGHIDVVTLDSDADEVYDYRIADADANGIPEVIQRDIDGSGTWDQHWFDVDGDAHIEHATLDADGDGYVDYTQDDLDDDGFLEQATLPDGTILTLVPETGSIDLVEQPGAADMPPEPAFVPRDPPPGAEDVATSDSESTLLLQHAAASGVTGVHGDADAAGDYWRYQAKEGLCVPASVAMIVSEVTGRELSLRELVDDGTSLGLLVKDASGHWTGMTSDEAVVLLDHYTLDARIEGGFADYIFPTVSLDGTVSYVETPRWDSATAMDQLRSHLDAGANVIIGVDADEVWGRERDRFDRVPGRDDNHVVVVTQVDDVAGIVTVNDPGTKDGKALEMRLKHFVDAWADSGFEMIVVDVPARHAPATIVA